jgi:folylpolyglutamate synthase/dihydropteroate synthase
MLCISTIHINSIRKIFDDYSKLVNATIKYVDYNKKNQHIKLNGIHQSENEALAIHTIKSLNNFNINNSHIKFGLSSVQWPARIQKIHNKPNIYFDVAHNNASFLSLCNFVDTLQGSNILILALQKNKIINNVISNIENIFDKIIITETGERNYIPAQDLALLFNKNKTHIVKDPKDALKSYKTFPKSTNIIIAGSHYLGPFISTEFKISFDNI